MTRQCLESFACAPIPSANGLIPAAAEENTLILTQRQSFYAVAMAMGCIQTLNHMNPGLTGSYRHFNVQALNRPRLTCGLRSLESTPT